jgi:polar amino acid transport system substrate-binding protein
MTNWNRSTESTSAARRSFLQAAALGGGLVGGALGGSLIAPRAAYAQGGGGEDVLQKVIKAKQINIAVVIYPPLTQKQGGELSGTFVEAAKWLAKQMDVTPNYVEAEFGTFIAAIQSGRADIALAGAFASVPRAMAVDFTKNVMWFGSSALVRKVDEKKWKTIEDADQPNVRFIQAEGTALHKQLVQSVKKGKVIATAPGTQSTNMALEVLSSRADIYIEDDWLIKKNVEQQKGKLVEMPAYVDKPWGLNAVSWAVAKGQTGMLNVLNVAIDRLTDNNMFQQWDEKYGAHWAYQKQFYTQSSKG